MQSYISKEIYKTVGKTQMATNPAADLSQISNEEMKMEIEKVILLDIDMC